MGFQITLTQSGRQFNCDADESVLSAALNAGIVLPYGCKNGACGSCKAQLSEGLFEQGPHQPQALTEADKIQNMALLCCAYPRSDVSVKVRELAAAGDIPVKKMPCRVQSLERKTDDVMLLRLQLPANEVLQFLAGQYIEFILRDGQRRSYSMANAPHEGEGIELHIRHMPGGVFTDHVFSGMKVRDILRFEGPLGTFFLREDSLKPMVLLASGTGFAPIQSILSHMQNKRIERPVHLYWGGRKKQDLYLQEALEQRLEAMPNVRFVPVLSDAAPQDLWQGRTGFVHEAVMEDLPDLSGFEVYACGAPVMVNAARRDFTQRCHLPESAFFADSFTSQADQSGA